MRLCVLGVNYGNGLWAVVAHAALRVKFPYAQRIILLWRTRKMCRFAGIMMHAEGRVRYDMLVTVMLLAVFISEWLGRNGK